LGRLPLVRVFPSSQTARLSRKAQIVSIYRNALGSKPDVSDLCAQAEAKPGVLPDPGLRPESKAIPRLHQDLRRQAAALDLKRRHDLLGIVAPGGTGTRKSALFNALTGTSLSRTGVERPKTPDPIAGRAGRLTLIPHDRAKRAHLVSVDAPEMDSIETKTQRAAEALSLIADAMVFVTSQENTRTRSLLDSSAAFMRTAGPASSCSTRPTTGWRPRTSWPMLARRSRPRSRARSLRGARAGFGLVKPCAKEVKGEKEKRIRVGDCQ